MKSFLRNLLLPVAGLALAATAATAAPWPPVPGDLILGVQATGGAGATTNVFFNLGPAHVLRDSPNPAGTLVNLDAELTATYGADWSARNDLYFGVFANRSNATPSGIGSALPENGDPARTIYTSKGVTTAGTGTPWSGFSVSSLGLAATAHQGQIAAIDNIAANSNQVMTLDQATNTVEWNNGWTQFNPTPGAAFSIFAGGIQAKINATAALVDVFRIVSTTGSGSYVTTVSLAANGDVTAARAGAAASYYTVTTNASNGSVSGTVPTTLYAAGSTVRLTAAPASGYTFANWTGDASGSANPLNLLMDGNKTVTANFLLPTPTVTSPTSTGLTNSGATLGGNITSDGGQALTERGVVFALNSSNPSPQIGGSDVTKTTAVGTGTGVFTTTVSTLTSGSTYAFAAYATNANGTGYSTVGRFTTDSTITFTAGVGIVTDRVILPGDTQLFRFTIAADSVADFTGTGATNTGWELRDGSNAVVASGVGNINFASLLAAGDYTLRLTNTGSTAETVSLDLDASTPAPTSPFVTAPTSTGLTDSGATLGGNIISGGNQPINERGVVFALNSSNPSPQIGGSDVTKTTAVGTGTGVFTTTVSGLTAGSTYAFAAYATSADGTGYSTVGRFTTDSTITFTAGVGIVTDRVILAGDTQLFRFTIAADSDADFTGTGATNTGWELRDGSNAFVASGVGNINFAGLLASGDYTLRLTNDEVTDETVSLDLAAVPVPPTVTSPTSTEITGSGATLGGNITSDGGQALTERGVVFALNSSNPSPQIGGSDVTKTTVVGTGTGVFTTTVSGLTAGETYAFAAYATSAAGTGYSTVGRFTTDSTITFTAGVGTLTGRVILAGDTQLFHFTIAADSVADFTGTGATNTGWELRDGSNAVASGVGNIDFDGLLAAGDYTLRLTNAGATAETVSLVLSTADPVPPTVTSPTSTGLTDSGATLGGNITSDGGQALTERGVVFALNSSNPSPQIGGSGVTKTTAVGTGTGVFTTTVSGLTAGSTYAFAAYATSAAGTGYSTVGRFTTDSTITFTGGVGTLTGRVILAGDTQLFRFTIAADSVADFTGTGATNTGWELRDGSNAVVASGTGNINFANLLAAGDYTLRLTNAGATAETVSLVLDASTPAEPKADVSVGSAATAPVGIDSYSPTPQSISITSVKAKAVTGFFAVDNDGLGNGTFKVQASAGNSLFAVSYFEAADNVTAQVIAGTFTTDLLSKSAAAVTFRAAVTPNKKKIIKKKKGKKPKTLKKTYTSIIKATASSNAAITDTATIGVKTK